MAKAEQRLAPTPKHWIPRCRRLIGVRQCLLPDGHLKECSLNPERLRPHGMCVIGPNYLIKDPSPRRPSDLEPTR
jgi:hypothetical protein